MKKITITDICREAGVSEATVSNVLNNKPQMSGATRKRVLEVIKRLKFKPSASARNLSRRKTDTVGVVLPWFVGFLGWLFSGIQQTIEPLGYYALAVGMMDAARSYDVVAKLIQEQRVDGVILYSQDFSSTQMRSLQKSPVPIVIADRTRKGPWLDCVLYDNVKAAYDATKHLIDHGHERIATLTGPSWSVSAFERVEGYKAALRDHGLPLDPGLIVEGDWSVSPPWTEAFRSHFKNREWPQAVVVANDWMALELLQYTSNHRDPKIASTAIIGFDNVEVASFAGLTTMGGPIEEFGKAQAKLLLDLIGMKNRKPGKPLERRVPMQLMIRSSCGCAYSSIKPRV